MTLAPAARWRASLALMVASGFAGLGYQVVWAQQGALWLGHEAAAVLAVVAAFFGGTALGAFALGERIEQSAVPARWYAGCEAVIGAWGALLLLLAEPIGGWALGLVGAQPAPGLHWAVAFGVTFVLLLPATMAMGATLPAIERVGARLRAESEGRSIAAHYASNTFGAVLGVLATAFWLVPAFGLARTAVVCVALNALCAGIAWFLLPRMRASGEATAGRAGASSSLSGEPATGTGPAGRRAAVVLLAATGLLGIGYEVVVVRVLGQVAEDTVYTFALLLAVYLVGSALGAAAYARWSGRLADCLLAALALACLAGSGSLWAAEWLRDASHRLLGDGMAAALAGEAALAVAAFALPTFAMGALFSHLAGRASAAGVSFGRALGANTLGAAVAPPLFGVWLAPWLGAKAVLLAIAVGYLALAMHRTSRAAGDRSDRVARWRPAFALPAAAAALLALALALLAPSLAFIDVPEGGHVISDVEGTLASVSVVEDAGGTARLRIDNRQQEGSSATRLVDGRQALLPMLLHPAPKRALFLGLGTSVTASTAAEEAGVQIDAVELLPEVIAASAHFRQAFHGGTPNPNLHLLEADARRYVRVADAHYDVIVADNFHPARSGSGSLYTVEHFEAVRARLAEHGLFCQWLPLHQLSLETLRSIVRSFVQVYPDGWALLASNSLQTPVLGLVARADGARFQVGDVERRLAGYAAPESPAAYGLDDAFALLGSFVAGPRALARFAGDAPLNTDDRPVVAYRAPRITYAPDSLPADRLSALLHELALRPEELLAAGTDAAWLQRLAAYGTARGRFIEAGRNVTPTGDVHAMLAQVKVPLLAVLTTSPDFRPARDPLLRMAEALARSDPAAAQALRDDVERIRPVADTAASSDVDARAAAVP